MSADFFTRLIKANERGPNMTRKAEGACIVLYECDRCEEEHDDEEGAIECCQPEVFEVYRCSVCRKRHNCEAEAESCHPAVAEGQPMQCPICLDETESFEEAADCCLFKHPSITAYGRQRIAQTVANGTPWSEAVDANINH